MVARRVPLRDAAESRGALPGRARRGHAGRRLPLPVGGVGRDPHHQRGGASRLAAAGGCGCHTPPKGQPNAGGRRYDGAYGTVFSSNITPDRQTGIGGWTDEQIITAIRLGRRPNGERLLPVHPYPVFNGMAEEDLRAIVAFLRTTSPVTKAKQPKKLIPMFESL